MEKNILVASTVRQKPNILKEFLFGLQQLKPGKNKLDYLFYDDNVIAESSELLNLFAVTGNSQKIVWTSNSGGQYQCDEHFHKWHEDLIWKVAFFKDQLIAYAVEHNYDYLFLIDSDVVLQPKTLMHLTSLEKDIVSEVFWTRWSPEVMELPQVWLKDHYTLYDFNRNEHVSPEIANKRIEEFLNQLHQPGTYKVGGLGACTLISKKALTSGVSFKEIHNVSFWGEDRHFCIRAVALGFELWADTHFPPFHIYRESELTELAGYKKKVFGCNAQTRLVTEKLGVGNEKGLNPRKIFRDKRSPSSSSPKLTLAMVVKNEAGRFLGQVLAHAAQYVDEAIIIDDASTDNTVEVCREVLQGVPLTLKVNQESLFSQEYKLRKQLWELTLTTNPQWILVLDGDEIFEEKAVWEIRKLLHTSNKYYYAFRLYDFWDERHYREDRFWCAHYIYRPFMVRYVPDFNYRWQETPQHCGRLPINITDLPGENSVLRLKHLGWMRPTDRIAKYERYRQLDPEAKYGIKEQYDAILDPNPKRIRWEE
jgi:glycosyltransferase involved in cell wall biosynthesis